MARSTDRKREAALQTANDAAWAVWYAARDTAAPGTWVDGHPVKAEANAALQRALRANTAAFHAGGTVPIQTPVSATREGAILGAISRGMATEEIEAALEGRPHTPGRRVERCPRCGTTGYAGQYPFSTGYDALCDDCGG